MDKHPARPSTTHPAVREIVDDASELMGSAVVPAVVTELMEGKETTVGAAGVVVSEAAGGGATTELEAATGAAGGD